MAVETNDGYGNVEVIEHKKVQRLTKDEAKRQAGRLDIDNVLKDTDSASKNGFCQLNLINQCYDFTFCQQLMELKYTISSGINPFGDSYLTIKWA